MIFLPLLITKITKLIIRRFEKDQFSYNNPFTFSAYISTNLEQNAKENRSTAGCARRHFSARLEGLNLSSCG